MPAIKKQHIIQNAFFLLIWTISASVLAYLVSFLGFLIQELIFGDFNQDIYTIVAPSILGVLNGFVQWLTLRKRIFHIAGWIPATGLAYALTFALTQQITYIIEDNIDFLKVYWMQQPPPFLRGLLSLFYGPTYFSQLDILFGLSLILGIALGICQTLVIKKHMQKAAMWIPLNLASSYLAYRLAFGLPNIRLQSIIFFLFHGLLTALAMLVMNRKYKIMNIYNVQRDHEYCTVHATSNTRKKWNNVIRIFKHIPNQRRGNSRITPALIGNSNGFFQFKLIYKK